MTVPCYGDCYIFPSKVPAVATPIESVSTRQKPPKARSRTAALPSPTATYNVGYQLKAVVTHR
ncbi:hypothetical protein [Lusitaniella coriacea]|uniref:hypothetical protein n=1 Tax=Lusitaniella coriacea TaxID=1983105 RepID=UPI003CF3B3B9